MHIDETPLPQALAIADLTPVVEAKLAALRALLATLDHVVVAFSGGVDSAFVLRVAHEVLGDRALALTARSASLPKAELDDAVALARELGARHRVVDTRELDRPGYVQNAPTRCYFCKTELFDVAALTAHAEGGAVVIDGFNADDGKDHQHGHRAANEHGVRHPLAEVGLGKAEVRALSKHLGLRTWRKPQLACLSSRVPHGVEVTPERLGRVEAVEAVLRRLGFFDVRARLVRDNDDMVRLEVGDAELTRVVAPEVRGVLVQAAHDAGFRFVTLDLEPFRSGRLSEAAETLVHIGAKRPRA
ncbi:ATP-dependent sacrificial sulfur transferase LarE [Myxococcota bacterium]|nr:ATP-dependent sacrificial sulfur transferase LarE [Myxococcota bacterium]